VSKPRKSLDEQLQAFDEKLAEADRKRDQIKARADAIRAKKVAEERKLDTRRKIVVGAAVMAYAELDPSFADRLQEILDVGVTRPVDRAAIPDLLPSPIGSAAAA
jgi:hypothetical protein